MKTKEEIIKLIDTEPDADNVMVAMAEYIEQQAKEKEKLREVLLENPGY